MKTKITIFMLASDTDYGTEARAFTTERAAYIAILDHPCINLTEEQRAELIAAIDDPELDFHEILDKLKNDFDAFSVDEQTLEIEVTDTRKRRIGWNQPCRTPKNNLE